MCAPYSMAHSGRPAEVYATLLLTEALAAALPGVRTRPERGPALHASRRLRHLPEIAMRARDCFPVLQALHDAKTRTGRQRGGGGGGAGTLDAFLDVAVAAAAISPSDEPATTSSPASPAPQGGAEEALPASPAPQGGTGEADIVFVLERPPSQAEHVALRAVLSEALREADCRDAFTPASPSAAAPEAPGSEPTTPPGQSTARAELAGLSDMLPSPERAPGVANASCYLLCEVTADARWLLHKLVQLELNARALALAALGRGASEAWGITPRDLASVVALVGVAAPLGVLSAQQARRLVVFIHGHLPFLAHMFTSRRLFFLSLGVEGHYTNVMVANLLFAHMVMADDMAAVKLDVAEIKGEMAELKGNVAEILAILQARGNLPPLARRWCCRRQGR